MQRKLENREVMNNGCNKVQIKFNNICYDCVLKMNAAIDGKSIEIKKENK